MTEAASTIDQAKELRRESIIASYSKPFYRYLVLGILTTVYISNFVDRQVINVLAAYIIEDLQFTACNSNCLLCTFSVKEGYLRTR